MTNKDDVWFLANAGVAGAVLANAIGKSWGNAPFTKVY